MIRVIPKMDLGVGEMGFIFCGKDLRIIPAKFDQIPATGLG